MDKEKISDYIISVAFAAILSAMTLFVICGFCSDLFSDNSMSAVKNTNGSNVTISEADEKYLDKDPDDTAETGIYEAVITAQKKIENYCTEKLFWKIKNPMTLCKKYCDKLLGLDVTSSMPQKVGSYSVGDLVAGYYNDSYSYIVNDGDITERTEAVVRFAKEQMEDGRDFLFVLHPNKYIGTPEYKDHSEEKRQEFSEILNNNSIDHLNLHDLMGASEKENANMFFKGDHHWLPQTALQGNALLCDYLNKNYAKSIDTSIFDLSNYTVEVLENRFYGSFLRKVTTAYIPVEDLPIVKPKYESDLDVSIYRTDRTIKASGTIEQTLYDYSALEYVDPYRSDTYGVYAYNNCPLISIHNNDVHDGSKVLFIKDSYANAMIPSLSTAFEDMYFVDLRLFGGNLHELIEEKDPDTVIVMYGIGEFVKGTSDSEMADLMFEFN